MERSRCPTCEKPLTETDKKSGPEAPEVGWEYYECSGCLERIHPRRVEPDYKPEAQPAGHREFTGVVVKMSNPVVLDDGDTVVECRGISSSVKLGSQITVEGIKREDTAPSNSKTDDVLVDCIVAQSQIDS